MVFSDLGNSHWQPSNQYMDLAQEGMAVQCTSERRLDNQTNTLCHTECNLHRTNFTSGLDPV